MRHKNLLIFMTASVGKVYMKSWLLLHFGNVKMHCFKKVKAIFQFSFFRVIHLI